MDPKDMSDDELLEQALKNFTSFIEEQTTHYVFVEDDPRNDEDYDTWDVGMEPIPGDRTWDTTFIDVDSSEIDD